MHEGALGPNGLIFKMFIMIIDIQNLELLCIDLLYYYQRHFNMVHCISQRGTCLTDLPKRKLFFLDFIITKQVAVVM